MTIHFLVNGFNKSSTNADGQAKSPSSGYHPPLPPKPRQLLKSRENSSAQTPAAAAEISADEADLIRELLYVFQVTSSWLKSHLFSTVSESVLSISLYALGHRRCNISSKSSGWRRYCRFFNNPELPRQVSCSSRSLESKTGWTWMAIQCSSSILWKEVHREGNWTN